MTWYRIGAVMAAVLVGVGTTAGVRSVPPGTTMFLRADLRSVLVSVVCVAVIMLVALGWVLRWYRSRQQRMRVTFQAQALHDHQRFVHRLDHELKNPLMAMRAGLANVTATDPMTQETLRSIAAQTTRLSHLAADLRKLADLETQPLEMTPVNVATLIDEVVAMIAERADAGDHHVTVLVPHAPWPFPSIVGDQDLLFLALHNLLDNAVKYTPPQTRIEVRAFEDAMHVVFEVADTGPGIPPNERPYVWEELYRGVAGRGVAGSGLGLALVQTIIQRHGGHAALRSRMGQGTVVTVRLPVSYVTEP